MAYLQKNNPLLADPCTRKIDSLEREIERLKKIIKSTLMLLLRTTGLEHVVPIVRDNLELITLYRQIKSNLGRNEEYRILRNPVLTVLRNKLAGTRNTRKSFPPLRVVFKSCSPTSSGRNKIRSKRED